MVLNAGKCHFMCLSKSTENESFIFKDTIMNNSKEEKMLGVTIDNRLTFSSHIRKLCKKASQKISAFSRISNQLNDSEKNLLFNPVVKSQFNYCPLVWMFCSRRSNNMINKVHERALRALLGDDLSDFESLLHNNKAECSHYKNIQSLMIEMFKIKNESAPPIMDSVFERRNESYNFCNFQEFLTERKRTVYDGLETLSYQSPQLWSLLPENIEEVESVEIFKRKVKSWICDDCPCRLCKPYLQNIGFL